MAISFEGGSWKLRTAVAVLIVITVCAPIIEQAFVLSLPGPLGNGSGAVTDQATVLYALGTVAIAANRHGDFAYLGERLSRD